MPVQKIGDVIARSGDLKALARHARRLSDLQQRLREATPPALAAATRVTDLKAGTLVVVADSSAVAAKLRQLAPRLLKQVQKQHAEVTGIRVDVQVKTHKIKAEHEVTKHPLPPEAIKDLGGLAEALPPSPLKSALVRLLARRGPAKQD
ncbi:MAG TPA: DciA family protein [Burkholderiales bacterium]|nr:DciA family protein [Burkholderiales bacterium]